MFITHSIYPLTAGDAIYNYGLVKEFSKYADLTIYSYVNNEKDLIAKVEGINADWHFYLEHNDFGIVSSLQARVGKVCSINKAMIFDIYRELDSGKYKLIILSHILMVQYAIQIRKRYPKVKFLYVSHNAESENYRLEKEYYGKKRQMAFPENIMYKLYTGISVSMRKYYEKYLLINSDSYLTIAKADTEIHKQQFKKTSRAIFCKPLIEFPCNKNEKKLMKFNKRLLMAGSMNWFPNIEGANWFVDNVFSKIVNDGYIMYFVGGNPAEDFYRLAERYPQKIIVTGKVSTMDEYFEKCDISIIPLFLGTGAKIKVLESIGRGIPTITTSFAAKGYDINQEVIIADDADGFINAIYKVEKDYRYRKFLFESMRRYYKNYMKLNPEIIELLRG